MKLLLISRWGVSYERSLIIINMNIIVRLIRTTGSNCAVIYCYNIILNGIEVVVVVVVVVVVFTLKTVLTSIYYPVPFSFLLFKAKKRISVVTS